MRLFVALPISEEMQKYLAQIQDTIRFITKSVRFVEPTNIHLTLKFLGEVTGIKTKGIIENLKKIHHQSIELQSDGLGFFPNDRNPKVLWVGLMNETLIAELHEKINSTLGTDFTDEFKFSAHITLGRIPLSLTKSEIHKIQQIKMECKKCLAHEFHLMESVLTPKGPIYSVIESFPLQ